MASFTPVLRCEAGSVPALPLGSRRIRPQAQVFKPPMRFSPKIVALAAACFAAPVPATADARGLGDLWATVNVCDTPKSPNEMGVRARMPGDGTRRRMYMRFTAQFRSGGKWRVVSGHGRSRWLLAGSARFRNEEMGYTFGFSAPQPGTGYVMRGLVQFEWRKSAHGKVERRAHRFTEAGHPTTESDPKGFSAATCRIRTEKANP